MKHLGISRNGLTYNPEDMTDENIGTLVLRSSNIRDGKIVLEDNVYVSSKIPDDLFVRENDILICSRNGSKELIGKNALIPSKLNASFGAFMMIFRPFINSKYMKYLLSSSIFSFYLGTFLTSTINQLTSNNFRNMVMVISPSQNEQNTICDFLDRIVERTDDLMNRIMRKIDKLQEYKKSLIYEYVTGKKQVQ